MNWWGGEIVLLHYSICPQYLFHTCKQQALTVSLWPWGSHSFPLEPAVSTNLCMLHLPKENYTLFFLWFTKEFLFGKHLRESFSCCDRLHSKLLIMRGEPLPSPNLLQGPLCYQVKGSPEGVNRHGDSPLLKIHWGYSWEGVKSCGGQMGEKQRNIRSVSVLTSRLLYFVILKLSYNYIICLFSFLPPNTPL